MNNYQLSRMRWKPISQEKYGENMAVVRTLYPKVEQIAEDRNSKYFRCNHFALISKQGNRSKFVLIKESRKCECGCELWDHEESVKMVPENKQKDSDITLLMKRDFAETSRGNRKVNYSMHPKFHELLDGSLDALLLVNL